MDQDFWNNGVALVNIFGFGMSYYFIPSGEVFRLVLQLAAFQKDLLIDHFNLQPCVDVFGSNEVFLT